MGKPAAEELVWRKLAWRKLASLAGQPGTSFCRKKISAVGEDHHPASISPTVRPTSPGAAGGWEQEATLPLPAGGQVPGGDMGLG